MRALEPANHPENLVADLELGDTGPDVLDDAGEVDTPSSPPRAAPSTDEPPEERVRAPDVRVGLADRGCPHPNEHLAITRHRPLDLLDVQDLGRPVSILHDGSHHALSVSLGHGNAGSIGR